MHSIINHQVYFFALFVFYTPTYTSYESLYLTQCLSRVLSFNSVMCLQSQNFMHSDTRDFKSELQESVKLIEMDYFIQYLKLYISNSTLEI